MQVDPIKPTLKAPGIQRLKLKYYEPLSSFGLKFNLRRCILALLQEELLEELLAGQSILVAPKLAY